MHTPLFKKEVTKQNPKKEVYYNNINSVTTIKFFFSSPTAHSTHSLHTRQSTLKDATVISVKCAGFSKQRISSGTLKSIKKYI